MLKVKVLIYELLNARCTVNEEERLMYILSGLDEKFDNVFSTIIENILSEKITIDDVKSLLLSHDSRLQRINISLLNLPSVNLSIRNLIASNTHNIIIISMNFGDIYKQNV